MKFPQFNLSKTFCDSATHVMAGMTSGAILVGGIFAMYSHDEKLIPAIAMAGFFGQVATPFIVKKQLGHFDLQPYLMGILAVQLSSFAFLELNNTFPEDRPTETHMQNLSLK